MHDLGQRLIRRLEDSTCHHLHPIGGLHNTVADMVSHAQTPFPVACDDVNPLSSLLDTDLHARADSIRCFSATA